MPEEVEDDEQYYIAFEDCSDDEISNFLKFLEECKHLSFGNGTEKHNIDGKTVLFSRIHFGGDFVTKSKYVEQLKFKLQVTNPKSNNDTASTENLDLMESGMRGEIRNDSNSLNLYVLKRILTKVQWFVKFIWSEDKILTKDLQTFELRRNNTERFNPKDLVSFLIRGTLLRSILNDQLEYEIEHFLKNIKHGHYETIEILFEVIDDQINEKYRSVKQYSENILKKKLEACTLVSTDDIVKSVIDLEIANYENYNTVRNKLTVIPLHKDLSPDDPLEEWIALKNCLGLQPLCEIKNYFGVKIATYFAWAGFYTYMLIIASILGLICMIFGLIAVPYSKLSKEICESEAIMCPRCDKWCDYWRLKDTCTYSILHHAIDNTGTIIYSVFMSLWAALYLQQWRRYIAKYNTKWDVIDLDYSTEFSRRKYVRYIQQLFHTTETYPYLKVSKYVKILRIALSFSICLLWAMLSLGMAFGILLYRMSLITSERLYGDRNSYSIYLVPVSTALLNLIGIQILNFIYGKIAIYFTELELQRTEAEYENSLSIKLFLFQFVNYYSGIFYIAILKGKFTGSPARYTRILGFRQEECNPGGCLVELAIQLFIIMTGRQAIKLATPYIISLCMNLKELYLDRSNRPEEPRSKIVDNYRLNKNDFTSLIQEYLEMVIQFGFVTLFVAAFPLAPLFALLNNILEVRLDGRKFLKEYRRSLPSRVKDIGVWLKIMTILIRLAAISNAVIIAFSSHLIPKWVYRMNYSADHTNVGYLNHSLAIFYTEDFEAQSVPLNTEFFNVSTCYYLQYRSADGEDKYEKHIIYWQVMAMRLAFIVVYQLFISLCVLAVEYAVPPIPRRVKNHLRRNTKFMMQMESEMSSMIDRSNEPANELSK